MVARDVEVTHEQPRRAAHHLRAVARGDHLTDLTTHTGPTPHSQPSCQLGSGEGRYARGEVVRRHRGDGVLVLEGQHRLGGRVRHFGVQRLRERALDRRPVLAEADHGAGGRARRGTRLQQLRHGERLLLAVHDDLAVGEIATAVLVVALHEVHQLHVGGVAVEVVAEDAGDQLHLVRGERQ